MSWSAKKKKGSPTPTSDISRIKKTLQTTKSHVVSAHAIDPRRVVAGILPLAAPATPAGAQLDNAMSARRGGDGGA